MFLACQSTEIRGSGLAKYSKQPVLAPHCFAYHYRADRAYCLDLLDVGKAHQPTAAADPKEQSVWAVEENLTSQGARSAL